MIKNFKEVPDEPVRLREETLQEMKRKRHAYAHEVVALVDELLALRRMFNGGEAPLSIPDLEGFLSPESEASRALWAQRYMQSAHSMVTGQTVEFVFGGHSYKLTKQVE